MLLNFVNSCASFSCLRGSFIVMRRALAIILAFAVLATLACGGAWLWMHRPWRVIATVDGDALTSNDLDLRLKTYGGGRNVTEGDRREMVRAWIAKQILLGEAVRRNAALAVAKRNAERHGVADKIRFVESDLFSALPPAERFDLLVSNPPYVAERERGELAPEVVGHEPHQALFAGADGLDCIAAIARQAGDFLNPGAQLFLEIGAGQGEAARAVFAVAPHHYENIQIRTDWAGRPRVLACRLTA